MRMGNLMKFIQEQCDVEMSVLEVDISDEVFLHIAKMAHENDITFNQQITIILENYLDRVEKEENPCIGCEFEDSGDDVCNDCKEDCTHDNTVSTLMYGNVCRDCGQNHVVPKEECE